MSFECTHKNKSSPPAGKVLLSFSHTGAFTDTEGLVDNDIPAASQRHHAAVLLPPPIQRQSQSAARLCGSTLEGWVYKQGDWRNPSFKKRWFLLTQQAEHPHLPVLYYFKSRQDSHDAALSSGALQCAGLLFEPDVGVENSAQSGPLHCFAMTSAAGSASTTTRRIVCGCLSASERFRWHLSARGGGGC